MSDPNFHILTPIPKPNGRGSLCGLRNDAPTFDSLDEAYRAHVEGWSGIGAPCRRCLSVALIAMGISNNVSSALECS